MAIEPSGRTRLVLVRHGRAANAEGRCIGHTDLALGGDGAADIHNLRAVASSVGIGTVQLVSSDLRRAIDSAIILSTALGIPTKLDPRLREMTFGEWDGREWSELEHNDGERLRAWTDRWTNESPPSGESVGDVRRRAADWLRESVQRSNHRDRTIIVVSHAGWIRLAVTELLQRSVDRLFEIPIDHAHATIVDCLPTETHLIAENVDTVTDALAASR